MGIKANEFESIHQDDLSVNGSVSLYLRALCLIIIILSLAVPVFLYMSNLTWQKKQNLKPQTQLNMLFSLGSYRSIKVFLKHYSGISWLENRYKVWKTQ